MRAHKRERGSVRLAEEYLEAVYELCREKGEKVRPVDVARALNVAPSTVKKVISGLCEKGYLRYQPYKTLELTEEGLAKINELKRRHDTVSKLFQTLGIDELTAEIEAEKMEHSLSPTSTKLLEALVEILNSEPDLLNRVRQAIHSQSPKT
ncbi:MAG: metal-dependent transcriptional regulator [Candidatus Caldarchaeum sp.]|nr:metal-dependent transcriptional regulator [Candidatus Caldarchaeum sp.]MCX8202132.1 metal-dependent transcriptional regulator [Candidatus Caldarchaeum sp.]MDW8435783.1 metal-dependent transcriptional regulator [Candidatus Caldarchaeum sp.]